jgi:hypothetical protein
MDTGVAQEEFDRGIEIPWRGLGLQLGKSHVAFHVQPVETIIKRHVRIPA